MEKMEIVFVRRKGQKSIRMRACGEQIIVSYPYRYPLFLVKRSVQGSQSLSSLIARERERSSTLRTLSLHDEIRVVHSKKERDEIIRKGRESLDLFVDSCAKEMNVTYHSIVYKRMRSRFGSCSSLGVLTFHYKIYFMNDRMKRYLIVHELAHLKHMNHSKDFWDFVSLYVPDIENAKRELLLLSSYL